MPAHPDLIAAFACGIVDGTLPPGLTAHAPQDAARRFDVYRNTIAVGLTDALAKRFPVIERLVGTAFFRAMAKVYLDANRPKSPVLLEWGETFPGFLAHFPPLAGYTYMADVARIELARGRAYHAADARPIAASALLAAAADPGTARLGVHPSVQVLHLSHPAVTIWAANQPGAQAQNLTMPGSETALVLRDTTFAVPVTAIGAGDAALVAALRDGQTLLVAAELATFADPGHNPRPILIRLMQAGALIPPKETR
ncbi:MAG: DNA-binding domain-containing protein [Pseudomonadota bacterium]